MTRGPLADIVEMIDATKHVWLVVVVKLFTKANSDGQRYTSAIRFFANTDIALSETQNIHFLTPQNCDDKPVPPTSNITANASSTSFRQILI